jgi:hypothetical protein
VLQPLLLLLLLLPMALVLLVLLMLVPPAVAAARLSLHGIVARSRQVGRRGCLEGPCRLGLLTLLLLLTSSTTQRCGCMRPLLVARMHRASLLAGRARNKRRPVQRLAAPLKRTHHASDHL